METGVQNSFIPHDATLSTERHRERDGSLIGLIMLVSIVLMIISLVLAAGVFMYKQYLDKSSASKIEQLRVAKAQFDQSLIQEFSRLDDRMQEADMILGNHIAPSAFFHMLENNTLKTVSFRFLDFEASSADGMAIKMDGVAESVNSVALQAELFSKVGIIRNPIFSDIDRQIDGVHFSFTATIDPTAINYVRSVTEGRLDLSGTAPIPTASSANPASAPSAPVPATTFPASQPVRSQQ
jgi:hypothetical protein